MQVDQENRENFARAAPAGGAGAGGQHQRRDNYIPPPDNRDNYQVMLRYRIGQWDLLRTLNSNHYLSELWP